MSAEELCALARRVCEEPPSRELDGLIYMATRPASQRLPVSWKVLPDTGQIYAWSHPPPHAPGTGGVWARAPEYTTSLDAARSISPWVLIHASDIGADGLPLVVLGNPGTTPAQEVRAVAYCGGAHALVAAFVAAALLARAAEMEDQDETR